MNDLEAMAFHEFIHSLRDSILLELQYYRFYYATVMINADSVEMKGGVMVECIELGAKDPTSYIRAIPMQTSRSATFPKIGDTGLLFFQSANPSLPRFLAYPPDSLITGQPVQMKHTILESPTVGSTLNCDELTGFTLQSKSPVGVGSPIEPTVLGTQLKNTMDYVFDTLVLFIDHFVEIYKMMLTHTHPTPTGPSGPAMPPIPGKGTIKTSEMITKKADVQAKKIVYATPGKLLSPSNKNN